VGLEPAPFYDVRPAANRKPATYRCPLCGGLLPALTPHVLIKPAGDAAKRRHAHTQCALRARREGRLPDRDDWRRSRPPEPSRLRAALRRLLGSRPKKNPN